MLNYKEQIHNYIISNRDEIVSNLKELVRIPSVSGESESNAPFGKACADVLEYTEKLLAKMDLKQSLTKMADIYFPIMAAEQKVLGFLLMQMLCR